MTSDLFFSLINSSFLPFLLDSHCFQLSGFHLRKISLSSIHVHPKRAPSFQPPKKKSTPSRSFLEKYHSVPLHSSIFRKISLHFTPFQLYFIFHSNCSRKRTSLFLEVDSQKESPTLNI